MKEFADKVIQLITTGDLENALTQVFNLMSLTDFDLKNEAVILRGRLSKLKSDVRKGVIERADEALEFNRIQNSTLELLYEMTQNAAHFTAVLADMDDSVARHSRIEADLDFSIQRKRLAVSQPQKQALFNRIAAVKERKIPFHLLWVHDFPETNTSESRLIAALDAVSVYVKTSEEAIGKLKIEQFDLIISDISRGDNKSEGIDFLKTLIDQNLRTCPLIFYIAQFNESRGTPPMAFGITNRPNELLHLVMDVMERK